MALEELVISPGSIQAAMNDPRIKTEMGRPGTQRPVTGEERQIIINFFKKYGPRVKAIVPDIKVDQMVDEVVNVVPGLTQNMRDKTIAALAVYSA